jgi:hypothetical protein
VSKAARLDPAGHPFCLWIATQTRCAPTLTIIAGITLALAGLLLEIATHWGHFG